MKKIKLIEKKTGMITAEQVMTIRKLRCKLGMNTEEYREFLQKRYTFDTCLYLNTAEAAELIEFLQEIIKTQFRLNLNPFSHLKQIYELFKGCLKC